MKKSILIQFVFLIILKVNAQHLNYPDKKDGDIIMNEVMVTDQTNCSYWETMGWNVGGEGGAYCGIQYSSGKPLFIYAIWDPSNHQPIKSVYAYPKSTIESFGGEGTGLHYLENGVTGGWKLNTWVRVVSRRWDYNGHSYFGYWSYDYGTKKWTHHVTMDYPVANVKFNSGGTNSFLEDWCGSPQNYRKGLYGNGYKRGLDGKWIPFKTAKYSGNGGASSSDSHANGGTLNGSFFMEFGGSTVKTVTEGQQLTIPIPDNPVLTIGQVASTTVSYIADSIAVSWITDDSKSPQFSYTIQVINSTGTAVLTKTDRVPHLRKLTFSAKGLAAGNYKVRVSMTDIFDQLSNEIDKTIIITTTGINDPAISDAADFTLYPNPSNGVVTIFFDTQRTAEATLMLYDVTGRKVLNDIHLIRETTKLDVSTLPNGIYFANVFDKNKNNLQRIKLIKQNE
jgi:hypothetical protein